MRGRIGQLRRNSFVRFVDPSKREKCHAQFSSPSEVIIDAFSISQLLFPIRFRYDTVGQCLRGTWRFLGINNVYNVPLLCRKLDEIQQVKAMLLYGHGHYVCAWKTSNITSHVARFETRSYSWWPRESTFTAFRLTSSKWPVPISATIGHFF